MKPNTKPLILIAEDDPDDQFMIHEALEETCGEKIETCFVTDGVELIEKLFDHNESARTIPALVLMDMHMPRKDGRKALKELREAPEYSDLPVVILTSYVDAGDMKYCSSYGAAGYFRKPNTMTELKLIVIQLYQQFMQRQ